MNVLALDTATEACSVALMCDDEVCEEFAVAPRQHNRLLFEMCDTLFAKAEIAPNALDALVFGCGPGAFTGVRIATSVVQGMAYAHDIPVVAISDLAALAQQLFDECDERQALALIDARMKEVYYGFFKRDNDELAEIDGEEAVIAPAQLMAIKQSGGCVGGSGLSTYPMLGENFSLRRPNLLPHAKTLLKLAMVKIKVGDILEAEQAKPVYLRDNLMR